MPDHHHCSLNKRARTYVHTPAQHQAAAAHSSSAHIPKQLGDVRGEGSPQVAAFLPVGIELLLHEVENLGVSRTGDAGLRPRLRACDLVRKPAHREALGGDARYQTAQAHARTDTRCSHTDHARHKPRPPDIVDRVNALPMTLFLRAPQAQGQYHAVLHHTMPHRAGVVNLPKL